MRRVGVVPGLLIVVLSLAAGARPAHAEEVTLNFSGTVDLTAIGLNGIGAGGISTFSGFFTWDSEKLPFGPGEDEGEIVYDLEAYQMIFNGDDYTLATGLNGDGNGVSVADNAESLGDGVPRDGMAFFAALNNVEGLGKKLIFAGLLLGDDGDNFWNSNALPENLDFVSQVSNPFSIFIDEESGDLLTAGTFVVSKPPTTVPEPSTLALAMLGAAGAIARRSKKIR